jgi:hypothetical protein
MGTSIACAESNSSNDATFIYGIAVAIKQF